MSFAVSNFQTKYYVISCQNEDNRCRKVVDGEKGVKNLLCDANRASGEMSEFMIEFLPKTVAKNKACLENLFKHFCSLTTMSAERRLMFELSFIFFNLRLVDGMKLIEIHCSLVSTTNMDMVNSLHVRHINHRFAALCNLFVIEFFVICCALADVLTESFFIAACFGCWTGFFCVIDKRLHLRGRWERKTVAELRNFYRSCNCESLSKKISFLHAANANLKQKLQKDENYLITSTGNFWTLCNFILTTGRWNVLIFYVLNRSRSRKSSIKQCSEFLFNRKAQELSTMIPPTLRPLNDTEICL